MNCLIFPLEEVKNIKNNSLKNNNNNILMNQNNRISLYDCFYYNQRTELFIGENQNYSNICNRLYDSQFTSRIFLCPSILILILDRGKGNAYNMKLDFTEYINIWYYSICYKEG